MRAREVLVYIPLWLYFMKLGGKESALYHFPTTAHICHQALDGEVVAKGEKGEKKEEEEKHAQL